MNVDTQTHTQTDTLPIVIDNDNIQKQGLSTIIHSNQTIKSIIDASSSIPICPEI